MSASPQPPVLVPPDEPEEQNGAHDKDADVRFLQFGIVITMFLWGLLVLALFDEVLGHVLTGHAPAIQALAALGVLYFTFHLTDVARKQFQALNAQERRLNATVRALQATHAAMERLASASVGHEQIARRQWVSDNPPKLRLTHASIAAKDGVVRIKFQIENFGKSGATIRRSYLSAVAVDGTLPKVRPILREKLDEDPLAGKLVAYGFPVEVEFVCTGLSPSQIPPELPPGKPFLDALIGAKKDSPATPEHPHIQFSGSIHYLTESFEPERTRIGGKCVPPFRFFEIDKTKV